jgi:hypothetical protein
MWAQLIKFRVTPGTGAQAKDVIDHLIDTA